MSYEKPFRTQAIQTEDSLHNPTPSQMTAMSEQFEEELLLMRNRYEREFEARLQAETINCQEEIKHLRSELDRVNDEN